jgi:hypothetical protein
MQEQNEHQESKEKEKGMKALKRVKKAAVCVVLSLMIVCSGVVNSGAVGGRVGVLEGGVLGALGGARGA